jgi:hypothetical protein
MKIYRLFDDGFEILDLFEKSMRHACAPAEKECFYTTLIV